MFYSPTTSIFRIFNEINAFEEIQNDGSEMVDPRWRLFRCKRRRSDAIIVACDNLPIFMNENLSDMLLLRL